ncbi:MAG TPA: hypothetical protein VMR81_00080 [Patescibacteria group bacterium]|jgi:hypothetical protein|nr:hypothetical protein [Patescibacteria group bacterium]
MKRSIYYGLIGVVASAFVAVPSVFASVSVPNFPSCLSPQGSAIASYNDGDHGIVGSDATYTGSDAVYQASDITLIQCFCSTSGQGIQTNWWRASSLTNDEIKELESEGWTYVPSGTPWGLDDGFYLTQNSSYSCLAPTPTPGGGDGGGGGGGGSSSGGSSSSSNSSSSNTVVAGAETSEGQILGLASTGDIVKVYGVFAIAFFSLITGFALLKRHESR